MRKILSLVCMFSFMTPVLAQELFIQKMEPKNKPEGTIEISSKQSTTLPLEGDTEEIVIQKMGKPALISNLPDGIKVLEYEKLIKSASSVPNYNVTMANGGASFNSAIAANGFGRNMYTGHDINVFPEFEETDHEILSIKIYFNNQGKVEKITKSKKKY